MTSAGLDIFAFGSSLTSAFWNGAATYYRGIYKNLHRLGYRITFAEPDIYDRQRHRDFTADPPFARCPIYRNRMELDALLRAARSSDVIVKHSGIGAEDDYLAAAVPAAAAAAPCGPRPRTVFWDVDAPATLAELEAAPAHPLRRAIPDYDLVFTYGGGPPVVARYLRLGARACFPIYNGLDPETHFPTPPSETLRADLLFLGHRLPDREARVRHFFLGAATLAPRFRFLLAGEGWSGMTLPPNVAACGFVAPNAHNQLNASARLVLNLNRDSMAFAGFSPPTRMFEAAGAGAAMVSDAWAGLGLFFEPGREILVASGPDALVAHLAGLSPEAARRLGRRARDRALAEHTYDRRARRVDQLLLAPRPARPAAEPALTS